MGSFSKDEECQFFDAPENIVSIADSKFDGTGTLDPNSRLDIGMSNPFEYEVWIRSPNSVMERRRKFLNRMGLSLDRIVCENSSDAFSIEREEEFERIIDNSGSMTRTSFEEVQEEFCSTRSSLSYSSSLYFSEEFGSVEKLTSEDGIDKGMELNAEGEELDVKISDGREVNLDKSGVADELGDFESTSRATPASQHMMSKQFEETHVSLGRKKRTRRSWLSKLRSVTCMVDANCEVDSGRQEGTYACSGCKLQKVKVRQWRKQTMELSALYMGQDIQAHEGSISTMKFSPDGQYLASAGEDGIVRLWQVVEDQRCNEMDIPEVDPSCIYFTVNHLSELTPLLTDKEKMSKLKSLKKTSDSACVIFPPKVFRLLEKPLQEFHGHRGDILDLSWSKNNYLLSSSVDKTVRLWRIGNDHCLKVFSHSNYVTCIQFNPVDDNYFISGSIDGKVRIWAIPDCHVVDWTDVKDIVTAVCYKPDGQGGIIGTMEGNCRFYNISENHLELDAQLCLRGKRKFPCRGITGFQFFPQDSSKVIVTCDSRVKILHGLNVIGKYKGFGAGSQMAASFTSDGKHILSASDDSNVYLWNVSQEESSTIKVKKIKSCERFLSNASVAVPWCGLKLQNIENENQLNALDQKLPQTLHLSPPASFSLGQEYFLEPFSKGSATWPEEKLPTSSPKAKTSMIHKSEYKFLKSSCKRTSNSHAWGLVIVTAGRDGRIKSFHNYGLPVTV